MELKNLNAQESLLLLGLGQSRALIIANRTIRKRKCSCIMHCNRAILSLPSTHLAAYAAADVAGV